MGRQKCKKTQQEQTIEPLCGGRKRFKFSHNKTKQNKTNDNHSKQHYIRLLPVLWSARTAPPWAVSSWPRAVLRVTCALSESPPAPAAAASPRAGLSKKRYFVYKRWVKRRTNSNKNGIASRTQYATPHKQRNERKERQNQTHLPRCRCCWCQKRCPSLTLHQPGPCATHAPTSWPVKEIRTTN